MSFWTQLSALLATTQSLGWFLRGNGLALLAQGADGGEQAPPPPSFLELLQPFLIPFVIIILMYQLIVARPQRREQAKRDELMKSLKKNDPVVTIGGIIGSVVSVSEDGSEVTVKVDDNARIKFRRDAIRDVIRKPEPAKEGDAK